MNKIEKPTILNDIAKLQSSKLAPIMQQTQSLSQIINRVQGAKSKIKPWRPKELCMYPHSPKKDNFSLSEGLGSISLQPSIDSLNQFKRNCINAIKTKFQAMGPETAKDSKLAGGAVELIAEVLLAAKCFTSIVNNVNNLVSTYINTINLAVSDVIQKMNQLEVEINQLKRLLLKSPEELLQVMTAESLDLLNKATGVFDILAIIVSMQEQLNKLQCSIDTLEKSPERVMMHLECTLSLLKSRIESFIYFMTLRDNLKSNTSIAESCYMVDDFLDDFDYGDPRSASYNWSLTNSESLTDYNTIDVMDIYPELNNMFLSYGSGSKPLIIDSKTESGYIVVPDDGEIISAGLDSRIDGSLGFIFELVINNGDTIIRSVARGGKNSSLIKKVKGIYYNKGIESIEYIKKIEQNNHQYEIILNNPDYLDSVKVGDIYYFDINNIGAPNNWKFCLTHKTTGMKKYFPVLYKVMDKTETSVILYVLQEEDIVASSFITNAKNEDYEFSNVLYNSLPGDSDGRYVVYNTDKNGNYYIMDKDGNYYIDYNSSKLNYKTSEDFTPKLDITDPSTWNATVAAITDPADYRYNKYVDEIKYGSITLKLYNSKGGNTTHSGEKIKCNNWALRIYPVGKIEGINKIKFTSNYPADKIALFCLKAHWGFIPDKG